MVRGIGVFCSIIGTYVVRDDGLKGNAMKAIFRGYVTSATISIILFAVVGYYYLEGLNGGWWRPFLAVTIGVFLAMAIDRITEHFTGTTGAPVNEIKKEEVTAEELRKHIVYDYSDELESLGVAFSVNNRAEDASVLIDIQKFKRVFGNIFGNSIKHFTSEVGRINVDISAGKDVLVIEVSDNGEGVEEEKLDIIFEPLYTSDEGRKVAGLGLSICREIVDRHGGRIYAKKSHMGGLAVCIELERTDKTEKKHLLGKG